MTLCAALVAMQLAGPASGAPLVGTTVNGTINPFSPASFVETQFTPSAVIGDTVEFVGAIRDGGFNQVFGISADFSDDALVIKITGADPNSNVSNIRGLFALGFGYPSADFPSIVSTVKTCASAANTFCASGSNMPIVTASNFGLSARLDQIYSGDVFTLTFTPAATSGVPEPTTWAMLLIGFGGLGYAMRRGTAARTRVRST